MSVESDLAFHSLPICDTCGGYILNTDQECPARDDGVCSP